MSQGQNHAVNCKTQLAMDAVHTKAQARFGSRSKGCKTGRKGVHMRGSKWPQHGVLDININSNISKTYMDYPRARLSSSWHRFAQLLRKLSQFPALLIARLPEPSCMNRFCGVIVTDTAKTPRIAHRTMPRSVKLPGN